MINKDDILKLGFKKVKGFESEWFEKSYNYYMGNTNKIRLEEHLDKRLPQFLNSYMITLCAWDGSRCALLKSECRDIKDIIALSKCFTEISCKKTLKK